MNMLATIVPKSDQINADDLIGTSKTIVIREVKFSGGTEQPVSMYFDGSDKAYRPCKSMCRVLVAAWGPDAKQYVGRSLTLYRDPTVKWGGMDVGGIRISHMSDIDTAMTMALTATKGSRKPFTVKPLQAPAGDRGTGQGNVAELSFEQAQADVKNAPDMVILRQLWSRKSMAPHRAKLQDLLDQKKEELESPRTGRTDEQHGDQHDGTERITDELVDEFDR